VVPLALARPLWWLALRSQRFMTGLMLLALALGAGGQATASAAPATITVRPAVVALTPTAEIRPATQFTPVTAPVVADEAPAETADTGSQLPSADRAVLHIGWSHRPATSGPATPTWQPGRDGYAWAFGQRAPPQQV
jgi:hypothetical protein